MVATTLPEPRGDPVELDRQLEDARAKGWLHGLNLLPRSARDSVGYCGPIALLELHRRRLPQSRPAAIEPARKEVCEAGRELARTARGEEGGEEARAVWQAHVAETGGADLRGILATDIDRLAEGTFADVGVEVLRMPRKLSS